MADRVGARDGVRGFFREPTLLFALGAALLFAISWALGDRGEVIEIDGSLVEWRILQAETLRGTRLDEAERRAVQEAMIDEQVLVREALALGLDDDERIHDILAQKMLHLLSAEVIRPAEAELLAQYEADPGRYGLPGTVTVEEFVFLGADPVPPELETQLSAGVPREAIATDGPVSGTVLRAVPRADLAVIFDAPTADDAFTADLGRWVGPYRSARGSHWIRPVERTEPELRPFEEVRDQVRLDWIAREEEARLAARVAELRENYRIRVRGEPSRP